MLSTQIANRTDLFISAKTTTAIPARHPLVLDALVQTTLDPQVRALEFIPTATVGASPVALKAIVVVRDDGRFHLDVVEARPVRNIMAMACSSLIELDLVSQPLGPLTIARSLS
jgi:hypothetical protein